MPGSATRAAKSTLAEMDVAQLAFHGARIVSAVRSGVEP